MNIEQILASLSLEQKVGQMFVVRRPQDDEIAMQAVTDYHIGGFTLYAVDFVNRTPDELRALLKSYQEASPVPMFIAADEEGGIVSRMPAEVIDLPSAYTYGKTGDDALCLRLGQALAAQCSAIGVNCDFAPVADVSRCSTDFIYDRTLGEDAAATAAYIAAVVEQMNSCTLNGEMRSIGSVLKHFPGYGNNVDTHTGIAIDTRPYETFAAEDFLPFTAGIEAGAGAVLVSHNIITCIDPDLPASLSAPVISVLRGELGFEGVILTDDLAMDAVKQYAENGEAAVLALKAGSSMIVTTDFETQIHQVLAAIERGELTEELIDSAVRYVLDWKYSLGLL